MLEAIIRNPESVKILRENCAIMSVFRVFLMVIYHNPDIITRRGLENLLDVSID